MSNSIEGLSSQNVVDGVIQGSVNKNRQPSVVNHASERQSVDHSQGSGSVEASQSLSAGSVDQLANLKALGNVKLSISIDETKQLPVIKIFDDETGKELIQIPAEHALNISRTIKAAVGAIFDTKA